MIFYSSSVHFDLFESYPERQGIILETRAAGVCIFERGSRSRPFELEEPAHVRGDGSLSVERHHNHRSSKLVVCLVLSKRCIFHGLSHHVAVFVPWKLATFPCAWSPWVS